MANNTELAAGSGGDTMRSIDRTTFKVPATLIDVGGTSSESLLGDSGVTLPVGGLSAEDAAVAGNPLLVGGRYDSVDRTLDDGDVGAVAITAAGILKTSAAQAGTWNITNVSGTISLPTGAATAAKQPALGTAGSASSDVITIQGVASMTPVQVADNGGSLTIDHSTLSVVGGGTEAAALRVTIANNSTGVLAVSDNNSSLTIDGSVSLTGDALTALQTLEEVVFADDAAFTVATSKVMAVGFLVDESSTDSANEGDIGIGRMTADRKLIVTTQPHTSGGYSISRTVSAASANATSVKAAAGQLYGWFVSNTNAAAAYLKIYNTAGTPTAGSGTPVLTLCIPGNTAGVSGHVEFTNGIAFDTGIGFTIVTGAADSNSTGVAANEVIINLLYK